MHGKTLGAITREMRIAVITTEERIALIDIIASNINAGIARAFCVLRAFNGIGAFIGPFTLYRHALA